MESIAQHQRSAVAPRYRTGERREYAFRRVFDLDCVAYLNVFRLNSLSQVFLLNSMSRDFSAATAHAFGSSHSFFAIASNTL